MTSPRILCVLSSLADAHNGVRVAMLQRSGFAVEAIGFERYGAAARALDCPVESLGRVDHRRYLRRGLRLLTCLFKVRAAMRRNDLVYAFGADLLMLALAAGLRLKVRVVAEIADLRDLQVAPGLTGRLFRALDKRALDACALLVVTSSHYLAYYRGWLRTETPAIVVENKVEPAFAAAVGATAAVEASAAVGARGSGPVPAFGPGTGRPLRIGYFGILKDEWSLRLIEALARSAPGRFAFLLAGIPGRFVDSFAQRVDRIAGLEYRGEYRHPDDLPALFESADMVMACYRPEVPHGWSRSNRYYDACLFRRPLIVRAGTGDAEAVRRHDLGLVIEAADVDRAAGELRGVTVAHWRRWRANMQALPPAEYAHTDRDTADLRRSLAALAGHMTANGT